ncbi:4-hydroxythreonine-4-phosphate dehydrogenase [Prochlorococcus marinus str. MIT 9321]|uniref:4-hydroxythreonine-4-phosphate dehydrogenase n=1 Tax=Prochlorococcus marinus str. MIT 9401 TaxID=167551 RepID=A0A0A2AYK0_PROMR|nr:4-hydroxythreonine-4-phosphate dehydrogenase PdxA [Prochlorococcus marinus]KGG03316.1 4-hydroxythreonine-4-phosphate dehydrogenase [Prochlorococcus marinus str. MIT 9321]KGG06098.1 4-hydroxythreonine-4-phosphate dehydrogenase [Prochlorococcus marinus str. MIT 9322]KGG06671.1 4-hydroxythreonine-4-phosphate dehydrogenase [Prochlorococcus marinus str. MIT 9401]
MNLKNKNNKFKIILSVGDESGVGPEIILKALWSDEVPKNIEYILVGSKKNLQNTHNHLKSLGLENLANPNNFKIYDLEVSSSGNNQKSNYGNSSFYYLKKAIEIVKQTPDSALVTGPICKKSWSLAGHYFSGQTEVLAKSCGVNNVGMLFTAKSPITGWRFNTLLATTHIALKEVPKKLNIEVIHSKLNLFKDFCSAYVDKPTFKVAGLNPHAGEEGILGNEEKDWLNDALVTWNKKNREIKLLGPLSPDSCWNSSAKAWRDKDAEKHDGILAMYHDQGLIPMKVIALNYSVNTTIGLPFIRTSPDHGTGFDIAGKGIAQSQSMIEAIKAAIELSRKSRLFNSH